MRFNSQPLPLYKVGDLVTASHEEGKIWEVEGYYYEYMYLHGEESSEMYYNLLCVDTSESKLGMEDELSLICTSEFSESYLRNFKRGSSAIKWLDAVPSNSNKEDASESVPHLRLTEEQIEVLANSILDRYLQALKFIEYDGEVAEIMDIHLNKLKNEWKQVTGALNNN